MIRNELKKYIEKDILGFYNKNDKGHDIHHVESTLQYALQLADLYNIDRELVQISVYYHDIACWIDRKNHHMLASKIVKQDEMLISYLGQNKVNEIALAIEQHRSKIKCTTLLSKILSDADKADACRLDRMIYRAWYYGKHYFPESSNEKFLLERCHKVQNKRYGDKAYFKFELPETLDIVEEDLTFSKKCLSDFENLFKPYARILIKQGVLK